VRVATIMTMQVEVVKSAANFANRWPTIAALAFFSFGSLGILAYSTIEVIGLAKEFGGHLVAQNRSMTTMMERCVVPDSELLKQKNQP